MSQCVYHPGRQSVITINGQNYCEVCKSGQEAAAKNVDRHVSPKDCFVWYLGNDQWKAITGTGCAHYVAHEKNITNGHKIHQCLKGYTLKVSDLTIGFTQVTDTQKVQVGDIYVTPKQDHCGLVSNVINKKGHPFTITIKHASSRQGKVAENDFGTYFKGNGTFWR
jgi:hypothetical protein